MLGVIIAFAAFLTVFFLVLGGCQAVFGSRLAVRARLHTLTADAGAPLEPAAGEPGLRAALLKAMGMLGRAIPRRSNLRDIQSNLLKARVLMRAEEFIGLTVLVGVGIFLILLAISGSPLLGAAGGIVGLKLPGVLVDMKKRQRSDAITRQLPEALSILSNGLRAGFSFPQALSVVVTEMQPPIAEEFERVLKENRIGKPIHDALIDLQARTDNDDLNLLITALLIQKQVGGNLAEVLDNISHTIRERVRIKGEIRTLTAEGRLSAVILALLPLAVAVMIAVINPDYVSTLVREPLGLVMIVLAVILQVIGILIIRKIISIDV
jgi:tight adherence protein B